MFQKLCFTALALGLMMAPAAEAKIFKNSYITFEMPENWNCKLETTEWVCRAEVDKESKEAVIVLTAKEVGPTDTFDAYTSHLSSPQATTYKGAPSTMSKVVYPPKRQMINDQQWIDGLHNSSEVPNYFTRYLATIKDKIAILFTCSAHKDFYTKYSPDFFKAVQSLRVIATKDLLAQKPADIRPSGETIGQGIGTAMPSDLMAADTGGADQSTGAPQGTNTKNLVLGLAIVLLGLGVYVFLKSKKK